MDTIINFGENLPERPLELAIEHSYKADLCIALGSSLRVTPAANIPETVGKKSKANLVVVNLQKTPLDNLASVRVFGKTDTFMKKVMGYLGLAIPEWILKRRLLVGNTFEEKTRQFEVFVTGVDVDNTPATILKMVTVQTTTGGKTLTKEPFVLPMTGKYTAKEGETVKAVKLKFEFMGNYQEPDLVIQYLVSLTGPSRTLYHLEYKPTTRTWATTQCK
jgi:mono-ADP-ribosyltransferase sirtuin 6